MSYQTGTANDVADLLDKWRLFLIANGWTIDFWGPKYTGQALQVHRDGRYWSWWSDTTINPNDRYQGPYITGHLQTGYDPAAPGAYEQPGASYRVRTNKLTGPMQAYHFFAGVGRSGAYAHVVIETEPGIFRHMGMGVLDKMGAYENGQYIYATAWSGNTTEVNEQDSIYHGVPFDDYTFGVYNTNFASTLIRCDVDGISPRYIEVNNYDYRGPIGRGGWRSSQGTEQNSTVRGPYRAGASVLTGRAPLLPLYVCSSRGNGLWSDIGQPPDMRLVRIDNMEAGQELALGSDTWVVFPVARKNGAIGQPNSGNAGFAYRKVA